LVKRSNISATSSRASVDGLARDAERLGDVGPGPPLAQRALDLGVLDLVREPPQSDDRGEAVGRVLRDLVFGADRHCCQP